MVSPLFGSYDGGPALRFRRLLAPACGAIGHCTLRGLVGLRQRPRRGDAARLTSFRHAFGGQKGSNGRLLGHVEASGSYLWPWFELRWDFQTCSFEVEKIGFGGRQMFPSFPWSSSWLENHCQRRFEAVGRDSTRFRVLEDIFTHHRPHRGPL